MFQPCLSMFYILRARHFKTTMRKLHVSLSREFGSWEDGVMIFSCCVAEIAFETFKYLNTLHTWNTSVHMRHVCHSTC